MVNFRKSYEDTFFEIWIVTGYNLTNLMAIYRPLNQNRVIYFINDDGRYFAHINAPTELVKAWLSREDQEFKIELEKVPDENSLFNISSTSI